MESTGSIRRLVKSRNVELPELLHSQVLLVKLLQGCTIPGQWQACGVPFHDHSFIGLWSAVRDIVLGEASPPIPTGDLAYRGTFSRAELESFNDPVINELINGGCTYNWMGPDRHSVFYPVRNSTSFNLVLM